MTTITGSMNVGSRFIKYYSKSCGNFSGCTVAVGEGVNKSFKVFIIVFIIILKSYTKYNKNVTRINMIYML